MADTPGNRPQTGGRWTKGQSGNPNGRPKGFGALIREQTKDGEELVEFALDVLRGKATAKRFDSEGEEYAVEPSIKERMEAATFLRDSGWGRPPQQIEMSATVTERRLDDTPTEVLLAVADAPAMDS